MEHHFTILRIAGTSTLEINFIFYYFKCHILQMRSSSSMLVYHDDVIKWKHLTRNWPFVRGIHRSR